jgi:DNA polymerase-3 subunit alpha
VKYVDLHHHTTYSFMDGYGTPAQHANRLAELGRSHFSVTEHGNVSSHPQVEKAAKAAGIVPIFGLEAYTELSGGERSRRKFHLTLLAENQAGYRSLMRIVSDSWRNYYQWPTVSGEILAANSEGIIVLSGCADSLLACSLLGGKTIEPGDASYDRAKLQALKFKELFGDRYYLETQQFPELERSRSINAGYEQLSGDTGIPLVATADCHYPMPDDNEMQVVLHAAGRGAGTVDAQQAGWEYDIRLAPPTSDDAVTRRLEATGLSRLASQRALAATTEIAARCNVVLPKADRLRFPVEAALAEDPRAAKVLGPGATSLDLIWHWMREGWRYRLRQGNRRMADPSQTPLYTARLKLEMEQITAKDFIDYFLMLSDIVRATKEAGIPVGPARGSAAASLVAYLLRITEIDPIEYPLMMFDRFIDPTRTDLPDVDLDFDDERRSEVRALAVARYGEDRVGNVANYVKYRGKNSIDDVARVNRVPKWAAEKLKGLIVGRSGGDSRADQALGDTIEMFEEAEKVVREFPKLMQAVQLEGNYRGMSIHSAGLVVGNTPITDICAMYEKVYNAGKPNERRIRTVSVDKYDAEYLGLLKADFLGLTTMGMIRIAIELAGVTLEELYQVPMDEPDTLEAFHRNDVIGIFQWEGRATRLVNKEVKPRTFDDLTHVNTLSRPGPLFSGTTAEYIEVRRGNKKPTRFHPIIDELTEATYGQIIFQEQILKGLARFGGLEVGRVHEIRRIISKKLGEAQFNTHSADFVARAVKLHGVTPEVAKAVWGRLVTAASYVFNVPHSVSYSMLAFWCMWLKVHYPYEFYTAQLRKSPPEAWPRLVQDAERHGVKVKGVTPALSREGWTIQEEDRGQEGKGSAHGAGSRSDDGDPGLVPVGVSRLIVAGWEQLTGVGPAKVADIMALQQERAAQGLPGLQTADDLVAVKGIGPKTLEKFRHQVGTEDPFGILRAQRILNKVREDIEFGDVPGLRPPRHRSDDLYEVPDKGFTTCLVMIKAINYQDFIENQRSRTGKEVEEITRNMRRKDLVTSCVLQCYDDGDEDIYLRINRFGYPKFKRMLQTLVLHHDVLYVRGKRSKAGFGISVVVDGLIVIEPPEEAVSVGGGMAVAAAESEPIESTAQGHDE